MSDWPKDITTWQEGRVGHMSIPFTWLLPKAQQRIDQGDLFADRWVVGGPAVQLMPNFIQGATIGTDSPGVLQRVNSQATRTTTGCPNRCKFCGIGQRRIEGDFRELRDWPDLPVICDNNLLAASRQHFDRVIDRLVKWEWCDFNQGLDARLVTPHHARRIAEIRKPTVRLALDHDRHRETWAKALKMFLDAGCVKSRIRAYVLCGFAGDLLDDWGRCEFVESFGVKALPMWFHRLDCLEYGEVTADQEARGWTKKRQRQLMRWYYQHSGSKPESGIDQQGGTG